MLLVVAAGTPVLAAALAIVRYDERATEGRFFAAVGLSAGAIFIKPGIAAFFLLPLFAMVSVGRIGVRVTFAPAQLYAPMARRHSASVSSWKR